MQSLADALAQALERANALTAAHEANARMAFVADASVALSASLDFDATLQLATGTYRARIAATQGFAAGTTPTLSVVTARR